jgi:hypothetical protein
VIHFHWQITEKVGSWIYIWLLLIIRNLGKFCSVVESEKL